MPQINSFLCKDCGKDTSVDDKDYYMVTNEVWEKYGFGRKKGMLCMDCLEERMGRKLQKKDILICSVTTEWNYYTASILNVK